MKQFAAELQDKQPFIHISKNRGLDVWSIPKHISQSSQPPGTIFVGSPSEKLPSTPSATLEEQQPSVAKSHDCVLCPLCSRPYHKKSVYTHVRGIHKVKVEPGRLPRDWISSHGSQAVWDGPTLEALFNVALPGTLFSCPLCALELLTSEGISEHFQDYHQAKFSQLPEIWWDLFRLV